MRKGLGVSPGVAIGTAYCIHEVFVAAEGPPLTGTKVQAELERFATAKDKVAADLRAVRRKVLQQVGESEAAIFQVHEAILHDSAFSKRIEQWIAGEGLTTQGALRRLLDEYTSLFARTKDEYLRERLADVRDVVLRLSAELTPVLHRNDSVLKGPLVLVADELLPSQVMHIRDREMVGIVTQSGGQTSHAAILARSRGVPAVSGVRGILSQIKTGDVVVVDGREGHVVVNPDPETESAFRKLEREFFLLRGELAANRDHPALSADGETVELLANINGLSDAQAAVAMGAEGVGLYRTEYLFLSHPDVPDEDEQREAYLRVIDASPNRRVTIRTLDLGGDKTVPYFGHRREANPFMGWRSLRLSFEHPDFFATQIRAILRAASDAGEGATVRMMFPMVTTLEEMRRVRSMVRKIRQQLTDRGIDSRGVQLGLMVEVPAAAVSIDNLLSIVDFVSIGSNDLVQYLMAADRDNPKVSHLCQPLSPPVLRVLKNVIQSCRSAKKPVTLCGEMAGSPKAFLLLFGMGLRSFSMSPAFVPTIKELLTHVTVAKARSVLRRAMDLKTTSQVNRLTGDALTEIAPELKLLEIA